MLLLLAKSCWNLKIENTFLYLSRHFIQMYFLLLSMMRIDRKNKLKTKHNTTLHLVLPWLWNLQKFQNSSSTSENEFLLLLSTFNNCGYIPVICFHINLPIQMEIDQAITRWFHECLSPLGNWHELFLVEWSKRRKYK